VSDARDLLERYLRQRAELGDGELVLERHTPAEVRIALSRGPAAPPALQAPPTEAVERPAQPAQRVRAAPQPAAAAPAGAMRPAVDAPARGASADEILALPVLDAVREVALGCPRCGLAATRKHVVFGEGAADAEVMVVGEAPGQEEDRTGRPFVGRAGKLLELLLASVGLPREKVYICNVLKCRPPGNRNPMADEVEACSPYLVRQVELIRPRAILAVGNFAAQTLLRTDTGISRLRGRVHTYRGLPLVPTYHPAALLRSAGWVRPTWEDLQRLRAALDQA
jgi:uracil-DNA glycosylase family 4